MTQDAVERLLEAVAHTKECVCRMCFLAAEARIAWAALREELAATRRQYNDQLDRVSRADVATNKARFEADALREERDRIVGERDGAIDSLNAWAKRCEQAEAALRAAAPAPVSEDEITTTLMKNCDSDALHRGGVDERIAVFAYMSRALLAKYDVRRRA